MDGRVDLIGQSGFPEPFGVTEAEDQGDLFTGSPQFETLRMAALPAPHLHLVAPAGHELVPANRRATFLGTCARDMGPAERSQFFESCLQAQENERLKLGRELHDSTGQLLLALRLEIARLREIQGESTQGSLLDEIEGTVREIDREIRAFSFTHYPAEIGREGLGAALRSLARGFANRTGLQINFSSIPEGIAHSGQIALALLRIAQEALLNVHRHAQAFHVQMGLTQRRGRLELTVRDDGVGIPRDHDLEESHGVGLLGMRHRVERLGGHFAIRRLKQGTKIIASVPA